MLNSEDRQTLNKCEELINDQFNVYSMFINEVIDKKCKFNYNTYNFMFQYYNNIIRLDINEKYTLYATYIIDKLKETPFHNQYLRQMKLKKINQLNDTKN